MDFCYLTISGGYFVSQLAILIKLYKSRQKIKDNYHFDAIFSASGGNIAAYISLLFNNNEASIERKLDKINHKLFITDWSKGHIKSNLINYFQTSLYSEGVGMKEFINTNFQNLDTSDMPEIWSLSYNQDVDCGALFCSKSYKNAIFKIEINADMIKKGIGVIKYVSGDVNLLSDICIASAAIPGVIKPIEIYDSHYIDGGVLNASSGSYFSDYKLPDKILHYHYVLPCKIYDIDIKQRYIRKKNQSHWTTKMLNAVQSLTSSQLINDKNFMFENWLKRTHYVRQDLKQEDYYDISDSTLLELLKKLQEKHYFMILYTEMTNVNIDTFTSAELKAGFKKAINCVNIEVYYKL